VIPEACPGCGTTTGIGRHCSACGADLMIPSPGPEHPLAAVPSARYRSPRTIALVASRWLWFAVSEPRYRRGWAIGAWFIPVANLVIPKQLANDLWRAGDPELQPRDPGWQRRPVAAIVHWWWAFYLIGSGLSSLAGNLIGDAASIAR
jgi:Domain of unknown function (DUF4328)